MVSLSKKQVLVVGGSGFLGQNLIEMLPEDKYSIVATYHSKYNINASKATPYRLDLSDQMNIRKLLTQYEFDFIYYFSSLTNVGKSIQNPILDNMNVIHMLMFLEELKSSNYFPKVKLLYASSGGTVYGDQTGPFTEKHSLKPLSPYGLTKMAIENYLEYYARFHGLNYVVLRYGNPYGRYQDPGSGTGVPNIFLYKVLKGETIQIVGNPKEIFRDYIYVSDAIEITIKIAESLNRERVYNIGLGQAHSLDEIISLIESITGKKAEVIMKEPVKGMIEKVLLDISRVSTEYDWAPKVNLRDGIMENFIWIQSLLQYESFSQT